MKVGESLWVVFPENPYKALDYRKNENKKMVVKTGPYFQNGREFEDGKQE